MLYVGTSGFSYADWVGPYYPEDLPKKDWLAFYAKEFNALEINFTYYRLPNARTLEGMAKKVPRGFLFTVKATQEMTHARDADAALFAQFRHALLPLIESKKFGAVLAQFPSSFRNTAASADYLRQFRERLADLPVVIELRHAEWLKDETFTLLRELAFGFCCVDEPRLKGLMPPIAEATADIAYVRFHGRNAKKWWQHAQAYERYDYTYSQEELFEWLPKIQKLQDAAPTTYLFANNHYRGQGIETARQLRLMLLDVGR